MTTRTLDTSMTETKLKHLTWMQNYALKKAHPSNLFVESIGAIWATYYLYQHNWQLAVISILLMKVLGFMLVKDINPHKMAETTLGKIALLHLHPWNIINQTIGFAMSVYAVWQHSVEGILVGVSIILLGHIMGWSRVDSSFSHPNFN